ncbi:MAG: phasin family protein [Xanthobacteraceae bacterium]
MAENTKDTFETLQRVFTSAWPKIGDTAAEHAQTFWKNQGKILESMNELSQSWFERRRTATQTAVDVARGIGEAKSPVDLFQEYQKWMMSSADRMMADSFACQKHLMNVAEVVAAQLPPEAAQIKTNVMATVSAIKNVQSRAEAA